MEKGDKPWEIVGYHFVGQTNLAALGMFFHR
jgi:hypothetical protein